MLHAIFVEENLGLFNLFPHSTMSIIEFRSSKDLELVESLVLDLCDPQEKANALSKLHKVILFSFISSIFHLIYYLIIDWHLVFSSSDFS